MLALQVLPSNVCPEGQPMKEYNITKYKRLYSAHSKVGIQSDIHNLSLKHHKLGLVGNLRKHIILQNTRDFTVFIRNVVSWS